MGSITGIVGNTKKSGTRKLNVCLFLQLAEKAFGTII